MSNNKHRKKVTHTSSSSSSASGHRKKGFQENNMKCSLLELLFTEKRKKNESQIRPLIHILAIE